MPACSDGLPLNGLLNAACIPDGDLNATKGLAHPVWPTCAKVRHSPVVQQRTLSF